MLARFCIADVAMGFHNCPVSVTFRESNLRKSSPEFATEEADMKRTRFVQLAGLLAITAIFGGPKAAFAQTLQRGLQ